MSGFNDPVAGGGGTLIRPSLHSPGYTPGSTGWSINKDGSVEFNNGTFRGVVAAGTFQGTDYAINASGEFFYSGTPGLGNLVLSITQFAGTDAYGNPYLAGFTSYDHGSATYFNAVGGITSWGQLIGNTPDTTHATQIQGAIPVLALQSGTSSTEATAAQFFLQPGTAGVALSDPNVPLLTTGTTAPSNTQVLDMIQGARIAAYWDSVAVQLKPEKWQQPVGAANWTLTNMQYRRDAEDNLVLRGGITYTGANVAAAGGTGNIMNAVLPARFIPLATRNSPVAHYTSAGVQKNVNASLTVDNAGNVSVRWGDGIAGSAHDVNGLATGDLFWVDGVMLSLGNIG